ncbi:lymphocyte activation gene 3 protein [Salarias fasciatus]|uniref:Lymphocyte activation gene 3 protein-like n=1 Tax=Salarias fasciatus TaxID=181472 RepID=A0A672G3K1_SALFA|nr:lymphocyte activation gene 3 protein-like [Salarias fasciatus]
MKVLEYLSLGMLAFIITEAGCERAEVLVEAGSQAVLPCKSSSLTQHNPHILWTKANKGTVWRMQQSGLQYWGSSWINRGSQLQRIRCPHSYFDKGDYSLQINSVTEEDGGLYVCHVRFGNQDVEREVMLRIITVSFSPSAPVSGMEVFISCGVTPRIGRTSVQWMLNNSPFVPQKGNSPIKYASIIKAKASVSGKWTCVVNYDGKEGKASASMSVRGIVQPSEDNTRLYAAVGSAATLPCVFSPDLKPLSSAWQKLKQGSRLSPAVDQLPSSLAASATPDDKSASLSEVSYEHAGNYSCAGTVQGQRLTRTMQLVVAKIVRSQEGSSVTLTCHLSDATEVTGYEWIPVAYDHNGTESEGPILQGRSVSLSGVSQEKWSQWTCRFYGEKGLLGNVTHHIGPMTGLFRQESSGEPQKPAAIIGFIGLGFLLLFLLLILLQVYKNHQRRKRILQYPALETIVHTVSNEREERQRNRVKK